MKVEAGALATDHRKKQIALNVKAHRERLQKASGRKPVTIPLTDKDRENMDLIKSNEDDVSNQSEAVSKALKSFVKRYED